jgi:DoxX-like family
MQTVQGARVSKPQLWAGRTCDALAVLFLLVDSVMKVLKMAPAIEGTVQLGYPESVVFGIGIVQLACLALYLVPPTSILGAILLTGYLGGAVATHVRVGNPLFTHVLFPIYIAALVWGALWLRDERLRTLVPLRTPMSY